MVTIRKQYPCVDCGEIVWRPKTRCRTCYVTHRYPDEGRRTSQYVKDYLKTWRQNLRAEVFSHYGGRCVCCGETEDVFLVIDHVLDNGAEERRRINKGKARGASGSATYLYIRRSGFPPDYQVLCHNCNFAKAHGGCPHARKN